LKKIIGLLIFVMFIFSMMSVSFAGTYMGKTMYGWVEKEVHGNSSSNETIVLITGVHPREYQFHHAVVAAVRGKSSTLSKKYVVYRVHVTKSRWNYYRGRMYGQLLANKFVVPDVKRQNPSLVVDIHEDRWRASGYKYGRFLAPVSKSGQTYSYASKVISSMPFLKIYNPPGGTSPKYVTQPISNSGFATLIYETYKYDALSKKYAHARQFISALNN
jgi:hypothetical protein